MKINPYKSLFLMSSAIHVKHGIYSTDERISQTLETCKSILMTVPNAKIYLLDGGYIKMNFKEETLFNNLVKNFYNFSNDKNIIRAQSIPNHDIVKNFIEIYMFSKFLKENYQQLKNNYQRIFKISGRYRINSLFDFEKHVNAINKIVIHGPYQSQFTNEITGGCAFQYMSRLWSFDSILTPYISTCFDRMLVDIVDRINLGGYIDIEHLLFKHLDSNLIESVKIIGIEGNIAPNGFAISE
jgi:hypothetical protein